MPPHKGYKQTKEHRDKISAARRGIKCTPEQLESRKVYLKWSNLTPEQQQRNRDNLNRMIENNKGKHRSPEIVQKITESNKGKRRSPEFRQRMVEVATGRRISEETRKKMGENRRGEKNARWLGGISFEPYCQLFNKEFKNRVRTFFEYKCVECGMTQEKNGKALSVHHVNYDKRTCCKEGESIGDRKFVALCHSCHTNTTNGDRGFWEDWYTEIINAVYSGVCYLPRC